MLTSVRANEPVKQEWLHDQIASSTELVVAKQADATVINPDSATMLWFLHRQRNHLQERQTLKKAARVTGDRVMRITQRPREDSSSDDEAQPTAKTKAAPPDPRRFVAAVLAVWGRPKVSHVPTNNRYKYERVCNVCTIDLGQGYTVFSDLFTISAKEKNMPPSRSVSGVGWVG
jgi:hypothetical protein